MVYSKQWKPDIRENDKSRLVKKRKATKARQRATESMPIGNTDKQSHQTTLISSRRTHTHTHTHTSSNQEVKNKQGNADGLHPKSLFFFHVLPRVMSIFQGQSPKTDGYMCVPFSVPASTANPNRPVDHDLRPSCGM